MRVGADLAEDTDAEIAQRGRELGREAVGQRARGGQQDPVRAPTLGQLTDHLGGGPPVSHLVLPREPVRTAEHLFLLGQEPSPRLQW